MQKGAKLNSGEFAIVVANDSSGGLNVPVRLEKEAGDDLAKQIDHAWRLAFCRTPTAAEQITIQAFFAGELKRLRVAAGKDASDDELRHSALVQLCRVMLNLNEFVYPD
ncbi:MAG: hypothetical protein IIC01_13095 [Planctomycetes bacterium]|nr:hypothetical protein [Planctomycetota bacterium]